MVRKPKTQEDLVSPARPPIFPDVGVEVGVTEISLKNGRDLTKQLGKPALVVLSKKGMEWYTTAYWGDSCPSPRFKWEFNGFAWGYAGEGPQGLLKYLTELGVKIDITKINRIQDKDLPYVVEI